MEAYTNTILSNLPEISTIRWNFWIELMKSYQKEHGFGLSDQWGFTFYIWEIETDRIPNRERGHLRVEEGTLNKIKQDKITDREIQDSRKKISKFGKTYTKQKGFTVMHGSITYRFIEGYDTAESIRKFLGYTGQFLSKLEGNTTNTLVHPDMYLTD